MVKEKHRVYLKLNLMSLIFIIVSFSSVTLAWFAYSGLSDVSTEIGVKAWYIELDKQGVPVSHDIVISLSEIYPGMDTINETVKIKNKGDSDAEVNYSIVSARILDNSEDYYNVDDTATSDYVEDILSHEYPFHINMVLSKNYAVAKTGESTFEVSISWPLDSGDDNLDTLWGTAAYNFQQNEEELRTGDSTYQIRPSIQIVINVNAKQYIEGDNSSDARYNLGDSILFDVVNNFRCTTINSTCLETHVIDVNNKMGDQTVTLLPNPEVSYITSNYANFTSSLETLTSQWTVNSRALLVDDLMNVISTDTINSVLIRDNISDSVIGNLKYGARMNNMISNAISSNGYYRFNNDKFGFYSATECYWTASEYSSNKAFAAKLIGLENSKIYGEEKTTSCNVVPIILVNKTDL